MDNQERRNVGRSDGWAELLHKHREAFIEEENKRRQRLKREIAERISAFSKFHNQNSDILL